MVEEHGNGASHSWDVVLDMNVKGRRLRLGCWLVFFGGDHFVAEAVVGCGGESFHVRGSSGCASGEERKDENGDSEVVFLLD